MHVPLRMASLEGLAKIGFQGYAIGGLAWRTQGRTRTNAGRTGALLADRPAAVPDGVGTPDDLLSAVERGMDMFDCVMPTRNARNGHLSLRREW